MGEFKKGITVYALCILVIIGYLLAAFHFPFYFDDAFISFRITENIKAGLGPSLLKDQLVYSSTSILYPYFNLIPAFLHGKNWVASTPFWNGFLISASFCLCLLQADFLGRGKSLDYLLVILPFLPWLFGHRSLIFGNSGLETGLYMLCLAACLNNNKFRKLSSWLIFIRPEGLLAGWAVLLDAALRRDKAIIRSSGIQLIISVAAWVLAGFLLYGTPIPQSIPAKANHLIDRWNEIQKGMSYALFAGYIIPLGLFLFALIQFREFRQQIRPLWIWAILYLAFFSFGAAWWPWYLPPLFIAFWTLGMKAGFMIIQNYQPQKSLFIPLFILVIVISSWQLFSEIPELKKSSDACARRMQASQSLADFLSASVPPGNTILLEPLGMLSWYGKGLNILDYPGLANPAMATYLHSLPWKIPHRLTDNRIDSAIMHQFRPDVLVLWPEEVSAFLQTAEFRNQYIKRKALPYFPEEKRMDSVTVFIRIRN